MRMTGWLYAIFTLRSVMMAGLAEPPCRSPRLAGKSLPQRCEALQRRRGQRPLFNRG